MLRSTISRIRSHLRLRKRIRHSRLLARLWRLLMFRTTVIALTGSVGKTTTRSMLVDILKTNGHQVHHTENNENDMWSLPATILRMRPWHKYSVFELSAAGPGTLKALSEIVRPDIAIVTSVAPTHTKDYEGIEGIAREKSELVRNMGNNGIAILNADNPHTAGMAQLCNKPPIMFSTQHDAHIRATNVVDAWPERLTMDVEVNPSFDVPSFNLSTQLVGGHWTNSVLAATAAALQCGVPTQDIKTSMANTPPFRGRMQPMKLPNGAVIIQDQNASDVVFRAMVDVARKAQAKRKILILGDLTDTSGLSRTRHRRRYAAQETAPVFDTLAFVGKGTRHAVKMAVELGKDPDDLFEFETPGPITQWLSKLTQPGDLIFIKGQHSMHLRKIALAQLGEVGCQLETCPILPDCDVCPDLKPSFNLTEALIWK